MKKGRAELWHEGFKAGQVFGSRCPYPEGSREFHAWEAGWAEAVMKKTGAEYSSEPPRNGWEKLSDWLKKHRLPSP